MTRLCIAVAAGLVLAFAACGTRAPSSPKAWITLAESHWLEKGVEVRFQSKMSFRDEAEEQLISADHRGNFQMDGAGRVAIEAETLLTVDPDDAAEVKSVLRNRQVADGEALWVETEYPNGRTLVTRRPLRRSQPAERAANRLSTFDIDPLSMWSFATAHATFVEELASEKRYVILIGTLEPSRVDPLLEEAGTAFRPRKIRLALDRDSGLPIELELLEDGGGAFLRVRYQSWRVGELPVETFRYTPPEGVEVVDLESTSDEAQG